MSAKFRLKADEFDFERAIGSGAFSKVWRAKHRPTGIYYAVKLISKRMILNAPTKEECNRMAQVAQREAKMLWMISHPNIIRFYASSQTPEDLIFVTELCSGGDLLQAITQWGRLPLEAARYACAELFSAVWYLHHGEKRNKDPAFPTTQSTILHRDIKPENIMLSENKHIKLIDFGTAVICDRSNDRQEGEENGSGRAQTFCGTTNYMSPELLQDNYTCIASDYWGCGCVLFHMLVGRRPFDAATPYLLIKAILEQEPEYSDDLDPDAKDLIQKLLLKAADQRPTMEEVRAHPFFASINFDTLSETDMSPYWIKNTPSIDIYSFKNCQGCQKEFRWFVWRYQCTNCGRAFCYHCLKNYTTIPDFKDNRIHPVCNYCLEGMREPCIGAE